MVKTELNKKRYHVDNTFASVPVELEFFDLHQICDVACSSDYEVQEHKQQCYEISYIVSGEGVFRRNSDEYNMKPGQLFITVKNCTHYIRSSKSNPLRYVCVGFDLREDRVSNAKFRSVLEYFDSISNPVATDLYNIYDIFVLMLSEINSPEFLTDGLLTSYLEQIVILSYRSFRGIPRKYYFNNLNPDNTNPLVYEIISYIDTDVTEVRRLNELSGRLGYSYGYLSKVFKDTMGISIRDYYKKRRFEKALELIKTDLSLTDISEKLGFANLQCFCKAFKKQYRHPPGAYRSKALKKQDSGIEERQ